MKTGTSDDAAGKVSLQPSEVLDLIKAGNPHAKRNLLAKQEQVMANLVSPNKENAQDAQLKKGQKTKAQTLAEQAESISKISENYSESRTSQELLLKHQTDLVQLEKLKQALSLNLLSQEQFNERAKALLLQYQINHS